MKIKKIIISILIVTQSIFSTKKSFRNLFKKANKNQVFSIIKKYFNDTNKKILNQALQSNNNFNINFIVNNDLDENRNTALHKAIKDNDYEAVKLLLSIGSKSNTRNRYGWAPLHNALHENNLKIAELLLKNGANPDLLVPLFYHPKRGYIIAESGGISSITPLHYAAYFDNLEVVKLLVKFNVNLNALTKEGQTAFDLAISNRNYTIAQFLYNKD